MAMEPDIGNSSVLASLSFLGKIGTSERLRDIAREV